MRAADPPKLSAALRERIAKLLGMIGSNHDGEALNAARLADGLVREARVTWPAVLEPPAPAPSQPRYEPFDDDWGETVDALDHFASCDAAGAFCRRHPDLLSDRELRFLATLPGFRRLSAKQQDALRGLVTKVAAEDVP
jgi:hypothetical protein